MKILGIDPGSRMIGHALIQVDGKRLQYIHSGMRNFSKMEDFPERLKEIYNHIQSLVLEWKPDHISMEGLIYVKSPTALIKLAQARGAMLAAMAKTHQSKIFEYSPNLVKMTATGHGHATKENIQTILNNLLGKIEFTSMDESDALAVAVCHALHLNPLGTAAVQAFGKRKAGLSAALSHMVPKEF